MGSVKRPSEQGSLRNAAKRRRTAAAAGPFRVVLVLAVEVLDGDFPPPSTSLSPYVLASCWGRGLRWFL